MHRGVASLYLLQHRHHLRRTLQAHVVTLALPHAVLRRNAATASRCPLEQERLKVVKDRRRATWNADIQVQVAIADVPVAAAEKHQSTANVGCEPTARTTTAHTSESNRDAPNGDGSNISHIYPSQSLPGDFNKLVPAQAMTPVK